MTTVGEIDGTAACKCPLCRNVVKQYASSFAVNIALWDVAKSLFPDNERVRRQEMEEKFRTEEAPCIQRETVAAKHGTSPLCIMGRSEEGTRSSGTSSSPDDIYMRTFFTIKKFPRRPILNGSHVIATLDDAYGS